jgi:hypothetical protein
MNATRELLEEVYRLLRSSGLYVIVFGGWAEELQGLIAPREHADIDLLLLADSFANLDALIGTNPHVPTEILQKRFSHKRAFLYKGIMVECILVTTGGGRASSQYWDVHELAWPTPLVQEIAGFEVASLKVLGFYRNSWDTVSGWYEQFLKQQIQQ